MIDGITAKTQINTTPRSVRRKLFGGRLSWKTLTIRKEGQAFTHWRAKYKGLHFNLTTNADQTKCELVMRGSWHRYWNRGGNNAGKFSDLNAHACVERFEKDSRTQAIDWQLCALEYGVNMQLGVAPSYHYNNLFSWGKKVVVDMLGKKGNGLMVIGKRLIKGHVNIKWYNKSAVLHYAQSNKSYIETPEDITRIEIHGTSRNALKRWGIQTIEDFRRERTYMVLHKALTIHVGNVNIVPKLTPTQASELSRQQLYRYGELRDTDMKQWRISNPNDRSKHNYFIRSVCKQVAIKEPKQFVTELLTQAILDTNSHVAQATSYALVLQKLQRMQSIAIYALMDYAKRFGAKVRWLSTPIANKAFAMQSHEQLCRLEYALSPKGDRKWHAYRERLVL